jgi:hypothetical protein
MNTCCPAKHVEKRRQTVIIFSSKHMLEMPLGYHRALHLSAEGG